MVLNPRQVANRSVVDKPTFEQGAFGNFVIWLSSIADDIQPWGGASTNFKIRDIQLRKFYNQEPTLASAIYTIAIRDASFSWVIKGDQRRTVKATQSMLHNANLGKGWLDFIQKWRLDFLTQDNGAFFEVIRQTDSPESPVVGINHLDAGQCRRTGVPEWPIIYTDRKGKDHKMEPHQIVASSDFPSPIETANNVGFCAVSRVLRQAQFMRDIGIRDRERSSGMDPKSLHIVSGVSRKEIEDVLNIHKDAQVEQGYLRYSKPAIFGTLDPKQQASTETLDLAPAPDQFNFDERMKWYITLLSMAIGVDYQDLAPLPSKGIGGSQQSLILHEKAKGKGPELFMKTIEHILNFHGIIPKNVTFEYQEKDMAAESEDATILKTNAEAYGVFVDKGILTPQSTRNMMLDDGLISQEIFDLESQGQPDATDEVIAPSDTKPVEQPGSQSPKVGDEDKTKENLAPFGEEARKGWEDDMFKDMNRALSKLFKDLKKKMLPRKVFGEKQDPSDIVEAERFAREFRLVMSAAMAPNARQIFLGTAGLNLAAGLAVDMETMNLAVHEFSRTYITQWLLELETTTREGLRSAILTWQQSGLGKEGLPDLVNAIEPLFGKARAQRIAATETTRVFDLGNKASHDSAGIEFEIWQTAGDDLVRDEHLELDGLVFPLNEGPRPSDFVNCRCARAPIATPEALEEREILRRQGRI